VSEGNIPIAGSDHSVRLMRALAEELRLPLLQIARKSELTRLGVDPSSLKEIETTADTALKLIDGYLLSTQLLLGQQKLDLEPVSLGAAMYDTAQYLRNMAKLYGCDIDIDVSAKSGLAMAHPKGLQAALTSLAYAFISANVASKKHQVILCAHKTTYGIMAGVLTTDTTLPKNSLQNARQLFGTVRRPMPALTHNNGAGIYVADHLFAAMNAKLKVTSQKTAAGLTALLLPSQQLALL
jgi:hypothetical protein